MRSKNKTGSPAPWSAEKALPYLASLCAKCEQCEEDLRLKMRRHCMEEGDMDSIIAYLYEHKFLDEERYARAYARDKMRFNAPLPPKSTAKQPRRLYAGCAGR